MKIDVVFTVLYPVYHNPEAIVVVVDVFRVDDDDGRRF